MSWVISFTSRFFFDQTNFSIVTLLMTQGKVYGRNSEILSGKVRSLELYEIPFINILTVLVCSGEE